MESLDEFMRSRDELMPYSNDVPWPLESGEKVCHNEEFACEAPVRRYMRGDGVKEKGRDRGSGGSSNALSKVSQSRLHLSRHDVRGLGKQDDGGTMYDIIGEYEQ